MSSTLTFGEYLLQKNAVKPEALAQAMVAQVKSTPSHAEIAASKGLIGPADLVAILSTQARLKSDFATACKEKGFWTPAIQSALLEESRKARRSYLQELIDAGAIAHQQLNQLFDSYMAEAPAKEAPKEEPGEAGALLGQQFNESTYNLLANCVRKAEDAAFRKVGTETSHRVLGASQFARFQALAAFFKGLEAWFAQPVTFQTGRDGLLKGLLAAWALRDFVVAQGKEGGFEATPEGAAALEKLVSSIKEAQATGGAA